MRDRAWSVIAADERALTIRSYEDGDDVDAVFVVTDGASISPAQAAALFRWAVGDGQREPPPSPAEMRLVGQALTALVQIAGDELMSEPFDEDEDPEPCPDCQRREAVDDWVRQRALGED